MQEIWRDVEGYEGLYQVSDKRRVKSLNYMHTGKEEIIKSQKNKKGYLQVQLHKNREIKNCLVHRLTAQAFIPNPERLPQINHIDENKENNCAENLEWCDNLYNYHYGTRIERVTKSNSIAVMCVETGEVFNSCREARRKTGIWASNINRCTNGKVKTARRYHWQFV